MRSSPCCPPRNRPPSILWPTDWVAVEVIVEEVVERQLVPRLTRAGATGIISYSLNKVVP